MNNDHFFFGLAGFCDFAVFCAKALPAADFEALLVRPSFNTDEAALAAFVEVVFLGALVWANALPAAVLDFAPVDFD